MLLISALVTFGSYRFNQTHGTLALLEAPDPLVLKGQEVYYQEGCQYCHTQNIRPIGAEVKRYVNAESYGFFKIPVMNEYNYETPGMRGSQRIGPDLARIAGSNMDNSDKLSTLLKGKSDSVAGLYHNYDHLFESDTDMVPVFLAWKIRMMMQLRINFSDDYQKSVFDALDNQTRGDALLAYLLSLGRKQMDYAGSFYE